MIEKVDLTNIPELIEENKETATDIPTAFGVSDAFGEKLTEGIRENFERLMMEPNSTTEIFAEAIKFAKEIATNEAEAACVVFKVVGVALLMNADAKAGRIEMPGM